MLDIKDFKKLHFGTVGSTNIVAREMSGAAPFAFITADEQTAGRTSKVGRQWWSPHGNLFFTALIREPSLVGERFPRLALTTALSVVQTVRQLAPSANIAIKWPNDILLDVKKVCGILIEQENGAAIIGVGVNVLQSPPPELAVYPCTSLAASGITVEPLEFAEVFGEKLISNINREFSDVLAEAGAFMYKLGKPIVLSTANGELRGVFEGLSPNGGLVVSGKTVISGEMTKENF